MNSKKDKLYFDNLVEKAYKAAQAYYHTGDMLITDAEYDALIDEITILSQDNPNWDTRGLLTEVAAGTKSNYTTVSHKFPMLSLNKAKTLQEVEEFKTRVEDTLIYEVKLDGLAVSALYEEGKLVRLATRGDGFSGDDITNKISLISGIPTSIPLKVDLEMRGEIYMSDENFYDTNESRVALGNTAFLNPRNAVAGIIRSLELEYEAFLSFACYDVISSDAIFKSYLEAINNARDWGAKTAYDLTPKYDEQSDVIDILNLIEKKRANLGFPIDGVVVKVNSFDIRDKLGTVGNAPKWACAYKYSADTATTRLKDIEVSVGRTGQMSLRAVLEPVYVAGTTITYATLHNPKFISDADIRVGDIVYVYRAGDVIPRVDAVDISKRDDSSVPWTPPQACIRCGKNWNKESLLWRCDNPSCSELARLEYALSRDALDIEGASSAVAEEMLSSGMVSKVSDIYRLDVESLSNMTLAKGRILGKKNATKIYEQIQKSKSLTNDRFFVALGLRTLGRTLSRRILPVFPTLSSLLNATEESLSKIEGIGSEKAKIIVSEIRENSSLIEDFIALGVGVEEKATEKSHKKELEGKTVVISGVIPGYSRDEAQRLIEQFGGKTSSSVSQKTNILISGEGSGSKYSKALELGIEIWTPEQFLKLI